MSYQKNSKFISQNLIEINELIDNFENELKLRFGFDFTKPNLSGMITLLRYELTKESVIYD